VYSWHSYDWELSYNGNYIQHGAMYRCFREASRHDPAEKGRAYRRRSPSIFASIDCGIPVAGPECELVKHLSATKFCSLVPLLNKKTKKSKRFKTAMAAAEEDGGKCSVYELP
jgi:hypothetical protein